MLKRTLAGTKQFGNNRLAQTSSRLYHSAVLIYNLESCCCNGDQTPHEWRNLSFHYCHNLRLMCRLGTSLFHLVNSSFASRHFSISIAHIIVDNVCIDNVSRNTITFAFVWHYVTYAQVHICHDVTSRKQQSHCPADQSNINPQPPVLNARSNCDSDDMLSSATVGECDETGGPGMLTRWRVCW